MPDLELGQIGNVHFHQLAWLTTVPFTGSLLGGVPAEYTKFATTLSKWEELKNDASKSKRDKQSRVLQHLTMSVPGTPLPKLQDEAYTALFNYRFIDLLAWVTYGDIPDNPPPIKDWMQVPHIQHMEFNTV
ncbi:hypothetical protein L208DRAFT_1377406 [Tricholoma matsutake]|nr:hypothetical protein L208DRAFT_1377406 [Tricholoma matsutake 945]